MSWRKKVRKVCHDVKSTSWRQKVYKYGMTLKYVMTSTICHIVKIHVIMYKMTWYQKLWYKSKSKESMSWSQKYVTKSKVWKYVMMSKSMWLHHNVHRSWRQEIWKIQCMYCIDTMLYICYSFIVIVIFYSLYAQVPWNFLYACFVK